MKKNIPIFLVLLIVSLVISGCSQVETIPPTDEVFDGFLIFIGLILWPEMLLTVILFKLGFPLLGILALLSLEFGGNFKTVIKTKFVDSKTGEVIREEED